MIWLGKLGEARWWWQGLYWKWQGGGEKLGETNLCDHWGKYKSEEVCSV